MRTTHKYHDHVITLTTDIEKAVCAICEKDLGYVEISERSLICSFCNKCYENKIEKMIDKQLHTS